MFRRSCEELRGCVQEGGETCRRPGGVLESESEVWLDWLPWLPPPLKKYQIRACCHWAEPTPPKTKLVGSSGRVVKRGEIGARWAAQARMWEVRCRR